MSQSINGFPTAPAAIIFPPSFQKESSINSPSPSQLFVFIDVHEGEILDSLFGIPPPGWLQIFQMPETWWDLPADRHNKGCNLSFADGHAEHWRWKTAKIFQEMGQEISGDAEMHDFRRVQSGVRPENRFPDLYQPQ